MYVENLTKIANFPTPPVFNAPAEGVPLGILYRRRGLRKLEWWGFQMVEKFPDRFSGFDTIPECDSQPATQPRRCSYYAQRYGVEPKNWKNRYNRYYILHWIAHLSRPTLNARGRGQLVENYWSFVRLIAPIVTNYRINGTQLHESNQHFHHRHNSWLWDVGFTLPIKPRVTCPLAKKYALTLNFLPHLQQLSKITRLGWCWHTHATHWEVSHQTWYHLICYVCYSTCPIYKIS